MSDFEFERVNTIKGYPELHWTGKRPYRGTDYYPAQLKEKYGEMKDDWINKIFWGDNLQVMSHMLKEYRGKIDLIYIDPPLDLVAKVPLNFEFLTVILSMPTKLIAPPLYKASDLINVQLSTVPFVELIHEIEPPLLIENESLNKALYILELLQFNRYTAPSAWDSVL